MADSGDKSEPKGIDVDKFVHMTWKEDPDGLPVDGAFVPPYPNPEIFRDSDASDMIFSDMEESGLGPNCVFLRGFAVVCMHMIMGKGHPVIRNASRKDFGALVEIVFTPMKPIYRMYSSVQFSRVAWQNAIYPVIQYFQGTTSRNLIRRSIQVGDFSRPVRQIEGILKKKYIELGWLPEQKDDPLSADALRLLQHLGPDFEDQ